MCSSCNVDKELNKEVNETLLKYPINYNCNCVVSIYTTLATMKYCDTDYYNWFHHLCQNEYDSSKYSNGFVHLHGVKKHCKHALMN